MRRSLLGVLLLALFLLGLVLWVKNPEAVPPQPSCDGVPVMLSYQDREATYCLAPATGAQLVSAASVAEPCATKLSALEKLSAGARLVLTQKDTTCEIIEGQMPASQRLLFGVKVNLNTASKEDLEALPGIGPSVAQKIIEDRTQNGPFSSIEELDRVKGIGPKTIEALRGFISVGDK